MTRQLAEPDTNEKQGFISSQLVGVSNTAHWIGGRRTGGAAGVDFEFEWFESGDTFGDNGPVPGFSNAFASGEPNDGGADACVFNNATAGW